MPMKYDKLFELLKERGMLKKDLLNVVSAPTMSKLSKGEDVGTRALCAICAALQCDISDIVEYEYNPNEGVKQASKIPNEFNSDR